jgi:hypothetical protein
MSILSGQTAAAADVLAMVNSSLTVSTTKSLTTVAGETVVVFVKGTASRPGAGNLAGGVYLLYNAVQKDTVTVQVSSTTNDAFCLFYTETPGAATHNITVTADSGITLGADVTIMVIKLNTKS